jgi:5-formyltetrahydrofolate cyclo-ligase
VYNVQDYLKDRKAILKKTGLRLKEMMREGRRAFEEERFEDYNAIMKQFSHAISILEPHEAREVKRFYKKDSETFSSSLQERLWRKGRQVLPPMESN